MKFIIYDTVYRIWNIPSPTAKLEKRLLLKIDILKIGYNICIVKIIIFLIALAPNATKKGFLMNFKLSGPNVWLGKTVFMYLWEGIKIIGKN